MRSGEPLLTEITTRAELRSWLDVHADTAKACWVAVSMKPETGKLFYLDVVEECLCFGWIDSTKQKVSDEPGAGAAQRLSPRSRRSSWTELNKERIRRLERLGLMRDEGRNVLPDPLLHPFKIDEAIETRLNEDPLVYRNFLAFPELYRRIRIDTIQSCRREPARYAARLDKFIAYTRENRIYGQWDDGGRLSERLPAESEAQ
ncbi:YdeI/OmpD-associated family protein [Saccharibacillus sp. CPCC 101409]|uniref:YdeI/OmpD-associated family protein n=1 Tax=Saccharibacillus sp. CPCC 101409 TaxID=3058041 RepID=UPI002672B051|nr:YdeI/OmpD-associated family protein [Saccharibacillus sp. CPCC 101409]MDO3411742.1 YdeI/OmpD-associated family protein [Saccharibacillus sp. CPCC 101409]